MSPSRIIGVIAACCIGTAAVAGCGSSASSSSGGSTTAASSAAATSSGTGAGKPVAVNVGNGFTIKRSGPLKVAFFTNNAVNNFVVKYVEGVQGTAKADHVSLTTFTATTPTAQFQQIQQALVSKKFNAWVIVGLDDQVECNIATQQAPQAGILVVEMLTPLCNRADQPGALEWSPGTLAFVGGNEAINVWEAEWRVAVKQNPGPQKVGIVTGPTLDSNTTTYIDAMKAVMPKDWTYLGPVTTDYSTPSAETGMLDFGQAHKDMTILGSDYASITQGAVEALKSDGTLQNVKVYDPDANTWSVTAIKQGIVQASTPHYSYTNGVAAITTLVRAQAGLPVSHFVPDDGHSLEKGRTSLNTPLIITTANINDYHPDNS